MSVTQCKHVTSASKLTQPASYTTQMQTANEQKSQELDYCSDDNTVLHKSSFCCRVGVPLFKAVSEYL